MSFKEAFSRFPRLETERMILRQLQPGDAEELRLLYADPEVPKWLDWDGPDDTETAGMVIDLFAEQYRRRENLRWGIISRESGKLMGTVILAHFRHNAIAVLGYDLSRNHWGKGLMQEAVQAVLQYAFEDLALLRIEAYVRPENIASARLLEKMSFEQEGLLHMAGFHETRKQHYDVLLFARLNPSLQPR